MMRSRGFKECTYMFPCLNKWLQSIFWLHLQRYVQRQSLSSGYICKDKLHRTSFKILQAYYQMPWNICWFWRLFGWPYVVTRLLNPKPVNTSKPMIKICTREKDQHPILTSVQQLTLGTLCFWFLHNLFCVLNKSTLVLF